MVQENRSLDSIDQLIRRINIIVYHYKDGDEFKKIELPMAEHEDYNTLLEKVQEPSQAWVQELQEVDGDQLPL